MDTQVTKPKKQTEMDKCVCVCVFVRTTSALAHSLTITVPSPALTWFGGINWCSIDGSGGGQRLVPLMQHNTNDSVHCFVWTFIIFLSDCFTICTPSGIRNNKIGHSRNWNLVLLLLVGSGSQPFVRASPSPSKQNLLLLHFNQIIRYLALILLIYFHISRFPYDGRRMSGCCLLWSRCFCKYELSVRERRAGARIISIRRNEVSAHRLPNTKFRATKLGRIQA